MKVIVVFTLFFPFMLMAEQGPGNPVGHFLSEQYKRYLQDSKKEDFAKAFSCSCWMVSCVPDRGSYDCVIEFPKFLEEEFVITSDSLQHAEKEAMKHNACQEKLLTPEEQIKYSYYEVEIHCSLNLVPSA